MSSLRFYRLYGLVVASEFPLPGAEVSEEEAACASVVSLRFERGVDFTREPVPAASELHASSATKGGHFIWNSVEGHRFRVGLRHEALIDRELSQILVRTAADAANDLSITLAAGAFSALLLTLRGQWPLHASAVALADRSIAIVGASGMGKSTWAAALCRQGYSLVTDDLLVMETLESRLCCLPGAHSLRLRSLDVLDNPSAHGAKSTDGRYLWTPQSTAVPVPLTGILIPGRSDITRPRYERLQPTAAIQTLAEFPRILGWSTRVRREQQFRALSALVRHVPVIKMSLPIACSPRELGNVLPPLIAEALEWS